MALEYVDTLYVGITNPSGGAAAEGTDPVRHLADRNPFTFAERRDMVLRSVEVSRRDAPQNFFVVPFELNRPAEWRKVIPVEATQYVVPHEEWDHEKAVRFEAAGYRVVFLETEVDRITATEVRRRITEGDASWVDLVPRGTADVLSDRRLTVRVRTLSQGDNQQKATDGSNS